MSTEKHPDNSDRKAFHITKRPGGKFFWDTKNASKLLV